ncbi:MAG TPA: WS/DGAT domain-containing protein, partial [Rubrivivax sp.]|nr:WS/DGAT domain-containing protein [Rubrivivax sp.]
PLKGTLSGQRRVASSAPLPSAEVRRVARAFDCSSHELLMACFSAALAGWLRARGLDPARIEWRVQVPVNLRSDADRTELGNGFGLLTLALPLAPMNPAARAWELRRRLRELQHRRRGELTRLLFTAVGLLAEPTRQRALELLSGKASAVLSCMPGPPRVRCLCGQTVDELMFWVPQGAGVGLGVSILNYGEVFRLGLMCDQALLPDPGSLLAAFAAEWERLPALAEAMQALPQA